MDTTENTISFTYRPGWVIIGETDETLESFRDFMRDEWTKRGLEFQEKDLPTISCVGCDS
jgi:uncharacterized protein YajQ (UPF0234 family)